jgi:hypothetical protein
MRCSALVYLIVEGYGTARQGNSVPVPTSSHSPPHRFTSFPFLMRTSNISHRGKNVNIYIRFHFFLLSFPRKGMTGTFRALDDIHSPGGGAPTVLYFRCIFRQTPCPCLNSYLLAQYLMQARSPMYVQYSRT